MPSSVRRTGRCRAARAIPLALCLLAGPAGAAAQEPEVPAPAAVVVDDWADRERRLRAAIRLNPREAAFHASLGEALARQGRLLEAVGAYQEAVVNAPRVIDYRTSYAAALERAGRADEAGTQLRAAIRLEPRRADLHAALGELLTRHGRPDAAADAYERAADLAPDRPEYRDLARASRRTARWSWIDAPAADGGAEIATRVLRALAAGILTLAGLALLLPLLGAIFLVLVATPIALLRGRSRRSLRPR